jgi:hypothetical protein
MWPAAVPRRPPASIPAPERVTAAAVTDVSESYRLVALVLSAGHRHRPRLARRDFLVVCVPRRTGGLRCWF